MIIPPPSIKRGEGGIINVASLFAILRSLGDFGIAAQV